MKSIALKKLSLYLSLALLFCSLPVVRVSASSVSDQSKPIFGLTADDVVEKYNQLTDQQKDQVLRSLGNTSIFANSLFGNIFNSTFGVLDDAIEKIGDLFFQANGVIYKLGSSALAWVSRLIDKVFNNDLNDLNISQPVIDDLYKNTSNLVYVNTPFFVNWTCPSSFLSYKNVFDSALNRPYDSEYVYYALVSSYPRLNAVPKSAYSSNNWTRLIVDVDTHLIYFGNYNMSVSGDNLIPNRYSDYGTVRTSGNRNYIVGPYNPATSYLYFSGGSWEPYSSPDSNVPPPLSFSGNDYSSFLKQYLDTYFVVADSYLLVSGGYGYLLPISHTSENINITNNTYYNYIYNIPDQTPLNVINIVSNTAIDYSPAYNIAYYLPNQYDIEQNFTVVNNYYISSGSAISSQGSIDVNLVSPSVIDVRIINPEDISSEVINENNTDIINNYDFDFGDLIIKNTVGTGIDHARDNLSHVVNNSSEDVINGFVSCIPSDWKIAIFAFMALGFIILVINKVIGK